jgi:hypothetical protein
MLQRRVTPAELARASHRIATKLCIRISIASLYTEEVRKIPENRASDDHGYGFSIENVALGF